MRRVVVLHAYSAFALLCFCSCKPQLPSATFRCDTDDECPDGWSCHDKYCYSSPPDGRGDAADSGAPGEIPDAARHDALVDTGGEDGPTDAVAPDVPEDSGPAPDEVPDAGGRQILEEPGKPIPDCEPAAADRNSIFVSLAGADEPNCGSDAKPCLTIKKGMERARDTERTRVLIDTGRYPESLVLLPGLTFIGGWNNVGGEWTRKCGDNRNASVVVASPSEIGVLAVYDGEAVLDTLTVETAPATPEGKSAYGVFARGETTKLTLREVNVRAADGGSGLVGAVGETPLPASGTCDASDGAAASVAGTQGPGGGLGSFDVGGYTPASGSAGGVGSRGNNGTLDAPRCVQCFASCDTASCTGVEAGQSCGTAGAAGCGGEGAAGGGGGLGGGASIAVYAWGAQVTIEGGALAAGNGGVGGPGGAPGSGGAGSDGLTGLPGASCMRCYRGIFIGPVLPLSSIQPASASAARSLLPAGAAADIDLIDPVIIKPGPVLPTKCYNTAGSGAGGLGHVGGAGSAGGKGGGGAGGPSYGVFIGGSASVSISKDTEIEVGEGGAGTDSGASGEALPEKKQ